ncbi:uncharacterized protein LOC127861653 isoform X1 [Dreissena polymorpha]|nr:uncharacterized protein LOC127861653 isoform X1 [Dreissena polymorpha]
MISKFILSQSWSCDLGTHDTMSRILDQPARKMFLTHLTHCRHCAGSTGNSGASPESPSQTWSAEYEGKTIEFSMVTTQGVIIETKDSFDSILIDDGTAIALVKGCHKIAQQTQTVQASKGQYVMVVGQLLRTGSVPVIRPFKIQNLGHNAEMATMWPLEVIDGMNPNVL